MIDTHMAPLALAVGAISVSALTPILFLVMQRRARKKDSANRLQLEDTHRREVVADAVRLASQRLLTASMEQELQVVEHTIHVIQSAIKIKLDMSEIVLPETNVALAALQAQMHALEVELFERKARHDR